MGLFDFLNRQKVKSAMADSVFNADHTDLYRHLEILKDCEELVNTSTNFETVLHRCEALIDELFYFCSWETYAGSEALAQHGIKFQTPPSALWQSAREQMPTVLCAAVDRALDAEIDAALKLKTSRGQEKRMLAFVEKVQGLDGVPADVLKYVSQLPAVDAMREPAVIVTCKSCGNKFRARPHAYKGFLLTCPKCEQQLRVNTSGQ